MLNLIAVSAQLLVLVGVAAIAESVARVSDPRLRLGFWRGVALACAALPLSPFVLPEVASAEATFVLASVATASDRVAATLPRGGRAALWLLSAGVVARLGWLCLGAWRLRQLRGRSQTAVLTPDIEVLRADLAPRAEVRVSGEIAQPAVFGLRRPLVLLPARFFEMDTQAQRAVACHELLHVARRDWAWILAEELTRSLFWFHPAVWWIVDRIQESREQVVDRLVVNRIPEKHAYMRALLDFAEGDRLPAPAAAFVWRHHLRSRLRTLAKEPVMSQRRFTSTAVALACVIGAAFGGTVTALPLDVPIGEAAGRTQDVVDGKEAGVTMPKVVSEVKPKYTAEAMREKIEGTVLMTTVVGANGTPGDIRVTRSLDAKYGLDQQAIDALAQWRFEPGRRNGKAVAVRVSVEMTFTLKK